MNEAHVTPVADLVEHDLTIGCLCGPDLTVSDLGATIVHHALDGRP